MDEDWVKKKPTNLATAMPELASKAAITDFVPTWAAM